MILRQSDGATLVSTIINTNAAGFVHDGALQTGCVLIQLIVAAGLLQKLKGRGVGLYGENPSSCPHGFRKEQRCLPDASADIDHDITFLRLVLVKPPVPVHVENIAKIVPPCRDLVRLPVKGRGFGKTIVSHSPDPPGIITNLHIQPGFSSSIPGRQERQDWLKTGPVQGLDESPLRCHREEDFLMQNLIPKQADPSPCRVRTELTDRATLGISHARITGVFAGKSGKGGYSVGSKLIGMGCEVFAGQAKFHD